VNWEGLICEECGCVSPDGRGWVGQIAFDPEDREARERRPGNTTS
jgi:hypothetical protein